MTKHAVLIVAVLSLGTAVCAQDSINEGTSLYGTVASLSFNMMGPFIRLDDQRVLAFHDNATRTSDNDGESWSDPRPVFKDSQAFDALSPTLVRTRAGTLILGFSNNAELDWRWNDERRDADPGTQLPTYVTRSRDDGVSWESPIKLHNEWTGDNRNIIQMNSGTIVLSSMQLLHNPGRHAMVTYSSRDDGQTWARSNIIDLGGNGHHDGAVEGTIVELTDGRLWMLIRTNWAVFWEAFSNDEGRSWRVIRPSKIEASSSPGLLKRLSSGRLVLFWNRLMPTGWTEYPQMGLGGTYSPQWSDVPASASREELSMAFSEDDGQTWTEPTVIAFRDDQISYPQVFEVRPGELWVTSAFGNLRAIVREGDYVE